MRVSEQQIFDSAHARLSRNREESVDASNRVVSGKRIEHPWDDPADSGLIAQHAQERMRQEGILTGASRASQELGAIDASFDQVGTSLSRAYELAVQLANDSYSANDRLAGGIEVQQLFGAVVSQLNVKFGDRFLFGGMLDNAQPFDTTGNYLGDTNIRQVEIAPGVMHNAAIRADEAFKGAAGGIDVLGALTTLATALNSNDTTVIRQSIDTLSQGIEQVAVYRSRAGGMMNVFDVATNTARVNRDGAADGRAMLEDVDLISAATRMAAAERALEASMSAASRQFRLTLLDKL